MDKQLNFWSYYSGVFLHPSATFRQLLNDDRRLKFGLYAFLIPAIGYTLFYIMAYKAGGEPSTFKPWLALPLDKYFYYDIFLTLPAYFLSLITAAAILQLLSKIFNGKGSFEDTFSVLGFGVGVATWSTMLHDLTDAFLGFTGVINLHNYEKILNSPTFWRSLLWTLFALYFIWFILLFTKGIKEVHKTSRLASLLLGIVGLIVYQTVFLIFIR
jgi:hypothetical protein